MSDIMSVVVRTCCAPQSGGGRYRRPVRVLVVRGPVKAAYRRGDSAVVAEWSNVDSRYDGPRSAYGQAIRAARAMVGA